MYRNNRSLFCLLMLALFAATTVPAQTTAPTYQNFVPPAGVAANAGEPSIGVNWNTGKIMFGAELETDRVTISGNPEPDGKTIRLWASTPQGGLAMTATAHLS